MADSMYDTDSRLDTTLGRLKKRIQDKQTEVKDLEAQARQVEEALKALK